MYVHKSTLITHSSQESLLFHDHNKPPWPKNSTGLHRMANSFHWFDIGTSQSQLTQGLRASIVVTSTHCTIVVWIVDKICIDTCDRHLWCLSQKHTFYELDGVSRAVGLMMYRSISLGIKLLIKMVVCAVLSIISLSNGLGSVRDLECMGWFLGSSWAISLSVRQAFWRCFYSTYLVQSVDGVASRRSKSKYVIDVVILPA